ncbi:MULTISPECIES: type II toxin-antitoxin system HicB family antitoxin [Cysteiniphilum]|uniref:HTH cro/C1-type domain-containing protein n=1 Tax=Cysteiniphilum litorale TaxID=2056700 RepID=A0A8J2Z2W8_9GAMM|nr:MULTISPECIES: type II toxin-antitoxin system HicB family antitoxin [Cysteiniphilum]GGF91211.1 hypothetical protein GCM10010995_05630 [Cysteiniphilum litorale]
MLYTKYPAQITNIKGEYYISFRDIPDLQTLPKSSYEECLLHAKDSLSDYLNKNITENTDAYKGPTKQFFIPIPSKVRVGEVLISPDLKTSISTLLKLVRKEENISAFEASKLIGVKPHNYRKIENALSNNMRIENVEKYFNALGYEIAFELKRLTDD